MLTDAALLEVFLTPLRECKKYKPAFGRGGRDSGTSFAQFQDLYGADPFYSWLGLASEEVYAAHKAAGGLTSVYRQLGIGSERLFRAILAGRFLLSDSQLSWKYEYQLTSAKTGVHTLDARITCSDLNASHRDTVETWLKDALASLANGAGVDRRVEGVAFEVRQGYKSADSKRQNADLRFGLHAYQKSLLPAFAILSNQVSQPVAARYRADGMLVLTGTLSPDPVISTFAFFNEVVGYDLAGFFDRNSVKLAEEVQDIVGALLKS
jgi:hypothetical protein